MRLIDADAVHSELTAIYKNAQRGARQAYSRAIDIVCDADTIEAEPVRHGQWYEIYCFSEHGIPMASYECTNCGNDIERQRGVLPAYCEFCGARMEGVADNAST